MWINSVQMKKNKIKLSLGVKFDCTCKKVKLQINYYFMALRLGQMSVCVSEERSTFGKTGIKLQSKLLRGRTKGNVSNNQEMQCF